MIKTAKKMILPIVMLFVLASSLAITQNDPFTRKIDTIRSIDEFRTSALSLLNHKSLAGSKIGVSVYSLNQKRFIFNYNSDMPLVPASVSKLFTSFMALNQLGSEGTVNTSLYTDAKEVKPILEGNIYLFGRGDALLSVSDLEIIAANIKSLGIKTIKGNIYADGSFFDNNFYRFHYSGDADEVEYVPPVSALSLDRNTAVVIISGGSSSGRPANVQVLPTSSGFVTQVSATVAGMIPYSVDPSNMEIYQNQIDENIYNPYIQNYGDNLLAQRRKKRAAPAAPRSSVNVSSSLNEAGKQVIRVSGTIGRNANIKRFIPISSPDVIVAGALLERLKAEGITVSGELSHKKISSVSESKPITLLTEFKRPLSSLLNIVNKNSDNYIAENVFKMVGANAGNRTNNKQGAVDYYHRVFDTLIFPDSKLQFNDGSGLSRRNFACAESIAYLLELSYEMGFGEVLDSSLALAGRDGTLRRRFIGTPAENNLRGKTGTHRNVSALAGFVNTFDGDILCFAIVSNGWAVGQYKLLENNLGIMLSNLLLDN